MSEVRFLLRSAVLLLFIAVLCTCARQGGPAPDASSPAIQANRAAGGAGGGPCAGGPPASHNRQAPIICVDDTGSVLRVGPDPAVAHDTMRSTKAPVTLQWFTHSGGNDLQLEITPGCVTDLKCVGNHCTAKTRDITGPDVKCKYDVWTGKHPRLDPDIIITECC